MDAIFVSEAADAARDQAPLAPHFVPLLYSLHSLMGVLLNMAEFLDTTGVSAQLTEIIKNAQDRLVIISPYLRVNRQIKELLEDKDRMRINVWVIYGKNELRPEENNWLRSMNSIKTGFLSDLHAKCYMNEDEALVTSMNLYEYSQVNNYEMGISVSREKDPELYEEIKKESDRILRACDMITVTVDRVEKTPKESPPPPETSETRTRKEATPVLQAPEKGFCIRCKADLPANPTQPYCSRLLRELEAIRKQRVRRKALPYVRKRAYCQSTETFVPCLL